MRVTKGSITGNIRVSYNGNTLTIKEDFSGAATTINRMEVYEEYVLNVMEAMDLNAYLIKAAASARSAARDPYVIQQRRLRILNPAPIKKVDYKDTESYIYETMASIALNGEE